VPAVRDDISLAHVLVLRLLERGEPCDVESIAQQLGWPQTVVLALLADLGEAGVPGCEPRRHS